MIVYIRKVTEKRVPGQGQSGEGDKQQQRSSSPFRQPTPRMPSSAFQYEAPAAPAQPNDTDEQAAKPSDQ